MKYNRIGLIEFISNKGIFKAPFVQRDFEWSSENILELLLDIEDIDLKNEIFCKHELQDMLCESEFFCDLGKKGITVYKLWDGLQRFVTVYLMLVCVVELLKEKGDEDWKMVLVDCLINENEEDKYYYKVQFSSAIKEPICDILNRIVHDISFDESKYESNSVFEAYSTIKNELRDKDLPELNLFYKKLHGLKVFFKEGESTDHMPLQFMLTNKRGKAISNYTYLKACLIGNKDENELLPQHKKYFKNMENRLIDEGSKNPHTNLERLLKFYLKANVNIKDFGKKKWVKEFEKLIKNSQNVNKIIEDIYVNFEYFSIIYEGTFDSPRLTNKIKEFRLLHYQSIDYFLFGCAKDYKNNIITDDEFIEIIDICENYLLRMHCADKNKIGANFINKLHTHGNKNNRIDKTDYVNSFKRILLHPDTKSNLKFPNNIEFKNNFVNRNWKLNGTPAAVLKFVEIQIQNSKAGRKHQNKIVWGKTSREKFKHSIDHVSAQNPSEKAKRKIISELNGGLTEYEYIHKNLLNNIGNLVPTLYNSEMRDRTHSEKCSQEEGYRADELIATDKVMTYSHWGIDEIRDFAEWKFEIILERFPLISVDNTLEVFKTRIKMEGK